MLISENDVNDLMDDITTDDMLLALLLSPRSAFFAEDLLINALSRRGQNRKPGHLLTNPLAEAHSDDRRHTIFISFFYF